MRTRTFSSVPKPFMAFSRRIARNSSGGTSNAVSARKNFLPHFFSRALVLSARPSGYERYPTGREMYGRCPFSTAQALPRRALTFVMWYDWYLS